MSIHMAMMRVAQVSRPGGLLELVERPIPDPGPGSVLIKVQACGVCHSDVFTKEGQWPGITFPRVPGHEVVGVIDAVGQDVPERWQPGQRVGVGWHAWHCFSCDNCRRGDFFACQAGAQVTGISFDGGYAEYLVTPATALARVPAQLPAPDAAPLMCTGISFDGGYAEYKTLVAADSDRILGFTAFAPEAGEVMTIVQLAMTAGLPYTALRDASLVHPTMAEGLARLFRAVPARP